MKFLTLFAVLTGAALAQEPAAPQDPAPEKPAGESPAPEAPSDTKPDLKPTSPDTKPASSNLKPTPPDLPALPDADPAKGQPGGRLKPSGEGQLMPDEVPTIRKVVPGSAFDRSKTRTAIKPPTTSVELDLRIRYRKAQSKAAMDPAVQAAWEESRTALTDYEKRDAMKAYYTRLFKKMLAIDKGLTVIVDDRQRYALRKLEQTRIDPTDPLYDYVRFRRDED